VAGEVLVRRRRDLGRAAEDPDTDETIFAFGERRLGRAFAETLLDPMVKGVFGGDARRLSLAAAFPRMVELEQRYGGLFRALVALGRERRRRGDAPDGAAPAPGPAGVLHSFDTGMAALTERLTGAVRGRVLTDRPVTSVRRDAGAWFVEAGDETFGPFDAVVDASPAHAAARHLPDADLRGLLARIPYAAITVVTLAFDRDDVDHDLAGFGMLIPGRERRRLLGVLWSSSIFAGRAPDGRVLLRCMAGGPGPLERGDDDLVTMAVDELRTLYGLRGGPVRSWVIRHERAIAQYEVGHLARLRAIAEILGRWPGLFLCGSSYRGIAVNACVKEAPATAAAVLDHLAPGPRPA
jgi:oxygen-dependent protoporphyrinogen oxidase